MMWPELYRGGACESSVVCARRRASASRCRMLDSFTRVRWGLAVILSSGALIPPAAGQPALRVREVGEAPHERGWAIEGGIVGVTLLRRGGHISEIRLTGDGPGRSINPLF